MAKLLGNNVQLELSRRQSDAAVSELKTGNLLADPEVEFEFLAGKNSERKYNLSVSQSFDWPGVYSARRHQIELEQQGLALGNEVEANEQRMALRALLIDITAANLVIDQLSTAEEGCNQLLETLEAEYKRGNVTVFELNKMRIEVADFKLQLAEARNNRENLTAELLAYTTDDEAAGRLTDGLSAFPLMELKPLAQYIELAEASAPSLLKARNEALAAKARRNVAVKNSLPGFSAGYRLSHEDGILFNGFTVGVNLPLWRASVERKAASAGEVAASFGENVEKIRIEKNIESAYKRARNLKNTISTYGEALTASDNAGLLERAYSSGAITLTELVLDINYFVQANVRYIELQRQYYNVLAELSRYCDNLSM
ncbi:MAG: TolC family protein [Muribaculaceae bacterium]|nr:TolC family protein [Muribaculaceae bacterium]